MSLLAPGCASPPPTPAVEIAPEARVASPRSAGAAATPVVQAHAVEPLPDRRSGAVADRAQHRTIARPWSGRSRRVLDSVGVRPRRVGAGHSRPDREGLAGAIRQVPARREDLDELVRWQMRKAAPFPIEDALRHLLPGHACRRRQRVRRGRWRVATSFAEYETLCDEAGDAGRPGGPGDAQRGQRCVCARAGGADGRLAARHVRPTTPRWRSCAATT